MEPRRDPELTTTAHTIRFAGADRLQTNLALAFALRGKGDFPFDTSDRTSGGAPNLGAASDWWGAATCPRSILIVAGDTFADALAAASLSDPTDLSDQPRLTRVAAADPSFDPIGGTDRVDTAFAPIVVTDSGRAGATALAQTARLTAFDLAAGGCTLAREAIIVGGPGAVPVGVERELIGLGYEEVFRVAGSNRYDTAARVAMAMGTEPVPAGGKCLDDDARDGVPTVGFYGNAVVEYRFEADVCRLIGRSVVLADGGTGADALAAGWWTSRWQVPVLLVNPDGSLPSATRTALGRMDVDSIIVLGGVARIPEATVNEAKRVASAVAGRIAGSDRYDTSVEMAKHFGGWFPTGNGRHFANDLLCVAASGGTGSRSTGWPDALAAGPLCGRLAVAAGGSPRRALGPVAGADAATAEAGRTKPSHGTMPIVLVPTGERSLPAPVQAGLSSWFRSDAAWCSGADTPTGCAGPGFGVIFGGTAGLPRAVADQLTTALSGGVASHERPTMTGGFVTGLDLSPVYAGQATTNRACFHRAALSGVRWLSVTDDAERVRFRSEVDILRAGRYSGGRSVPVCAALPSARQAVTAVGIDGRGTAPLLLDAAANRVALSGAIDQNGAMEATLEGFHVRVTGRPRTRVDLIRAGSATATIVDATLDLDVRSNASGPTGVEGVFLVETASGAVPGVVVAEARQVGDLWEIRGSVRLDAEGGPLVVGGFTATIDPGANDNANVRWRFDASSQGWAS